jgi:hypothetical protein
VGHVGEEEEVEQIDHQDGPPLAATQRNRFHTVQLSHHFYIAQAVHPQVDA